MQKGFFALFLQLLAMYTFPCCFGFFLIFTFIISLLLFLNHLGFDVEIWLRVLTKLLLLGRMLVQELHRSSVPQEKNDFLSEAHEATDE